MTRRQSFWGWGWEDRFPDRSARRNLGRQAAALLGGIELEAHDPPRLDDVELPEPRCNVPERLRDIATPEPFARASHTYGKSYPDLVRGFRGELDPAPDFVAQPRTEADVERVLEICQDRGIAVVPFGGGTSVVSGVEPRVGDGYPGVCSLDLKALSRVLEIDEVSRAARIQAGATGPVLEQQLGERGLTLRHFPQSFEFSTLGGWIATRASGHFATVYTHIDDLVESTRMLTPRGAMHTARVPASGAGPSPDRMVLGSEGILGVITEAWMRIRPRPRWRTNASVHFHDWDRAVAAVREISQSGLFPSNCRLLDKREALINGVSADGTHVLLLGFESADHPMGPWMDRALAIAAEHGGTCPDGPRQRDTEAGPADPGGDETAGSWRSAFLEAPYLQNSMVSLGVIADTFETACTWDRFDELHAAVIHEVKDAMRRVCGQGWITCRFTHVYPDGPAPYFTFLAPARRGAELDQWAEIKQAASEALQAHGGTITHHHAVGRVHRPGYDRQRPPLFAEALAAAKRQLDPAAILNPGVLLDGG